MKLRVATADLCLVSLLCFHSTCNGIEHSSPSHHTINLVHICDVNTLNLFISLYTLISSQNNQDHKVKICIINIGVLHCVGDDDRKTF